MSLSLEQKQMSSGELAETADAVIKPHSIVWTMSACGGVVVNKCALLRTFGLFYEDLGAVQLTNIRTRLAHQLALFS